MYHFRKYLTKEQIFTIPNAMSLFRLLLIPVIIRSYWKGSYYFAVGMVLLSALTDVLDGFVARKFHMVSDLGKMLDPISDKLTHAALLLCLLRRYGYIKILLLLLGIKELTMLVLGWISVKRRETVHGAKWYGKLCTAVFEAAMILLMLFPELPAWAVSGLLSLCTAVMLFSLLMYSVFFLRVILTGETMGKRRREKTGGETE